MRSPRGAGQPERKVRASLLDRLLDDEPAGAVERPPFRVQTRSRFARSMIRDLSWLLNTRTTERFDVGEAGPRSVLDYGVDDFTHLAPASFDDQRLVARYVRDAIAAFEPRLQVRRLVVEPLEGKPAVCSVYVEAMLVAEGIREPVSFRAVFDTNEGSVEVHGR